MRKLLTLTIWVALVAAKLPAGTVSYEFTVLPYTPPANSPAGSEEVQITYQLSNITFGANQELDISFDPTLYSSLSNGVAPASFELNLFQPNDPIGAPGDYSAYALSSFNGALGTFSVDAIYLGSGTPGAQSYTLNQYDSNGNFVDTISTGSTTPLTTSVPEPGSFQLGGIGLLLCAGGWILRRWSRGAA